MIASWITKDEKILYLINLHVNKKRTRISKLPHSNLKLYFVSKLKPIFCGFHIASDIKMNSSENSAKIVAKEEPRQRDDSGGYFFLLKRLILWKVNELLPELIRRARSLHPGWIVGENVWEKVGKYK